jgi:hypothetical protein
VFKIVKRINKYFGENKKLEESLLKFIGSLKNLTLSKLEGKYTFNIIQMEIIPRSISGLPSGRQNIPIIEINVILRQTVPYQ